MRLDLFELELRRLLLVMTQAFVGTDNAGDVVVEDAAAVLMPKLLKNCWFLMRDILFNFFDMLAVEFGNNTI